MDFCITIRTIVMRGDEAMIQAGAGIVADSDPEKEWEEIHSKARILFRAAGAKDRAETIR
jgi:anthranilate synthase component 1